jgi:fumarate hydratase subunit alpha
LRGIILKEIYFEDIASAVEILCIDANLNLPCDLKRKIETAKEKETDKTAKDVFSVLEENLKSAKKLSVPICQDTGMAVVFLEIGRDVHFNCDVRDAVNEGVRRGYKKGNLRFSVVEDPLRRKNTGDNTPAIIYEEITEGDSLKITVAPKGFGSENMSAIKMFNPTASEEDIVSFVVETVKNAGSNPCPPLVLGVGIGGDFEYAAYLSKKALTKDISNKNPDEFYENLSKKILDEVNKTGIGPQGLGGKSTALAVNILSYPTHIAGLPVAVNIGCHVTRHKSKTI